jgi:hypothetical protein
MRVEGYGIAMDLGPAWEARIFRNPDADDGSAMPIAHVGNFAIPVDPSNFAQRIIQQLDRSRALIAVVEYMKEAAGTPLFTSGRWPPRLDLADLNPNAFAGPHPPGVAGHQNFVTVRGRAFCVYVVMPLAGGSAPLLDEVNAVLETLSIGDGP